VFVADEQARDIVHTERDGARRNGRCLRCAFTTCRTSALPRDSPGSFINTLNLINGVSGVYDVPAVFVNAKLFVTNTVPTAAYRGAGRPLRPRDGDASSTRPRTKSA
jgi:carbon-monoxide dehydrogenase large subunit